MIMLLESCSATYTRQVHFVLCHWIKTDTHFYFFCVLIFFFWKVSNHFCFRFFERESDWKMFMANVRENDKQRVCATPKQNLFQFGQSCTGYLMVLWYA